MRGSLGLQPAIPRLTRAYRTSRNESVDVLVVDDDPCSARFLCECLELGGLTSACASNGFEALHLFEKELPRLILLDIRMPLMSGIELLHRMQSLPHLCQIPTIFVSGENPADLTDPLARTIPFIRKPVDVPRLLNSISELISPRAANAVMSY